MRRASLFAVIAACALGAPEPASAGWSDAGALATPRESATATTLATGKVLVAGGYRSDAQGVYYLASAELYDPVSNRWSAAGSMATGRTQPSTILLQDGRVLAVGGFAGADPLASAELYDPASNAWTSAGSMAVGREAPAVSLLDNGKVLVAGGFTAGGRTPRAELYDPATNQWSSAASMTYPRSGPVATRLANGKVLVTGAADFGGSIVPEVYDPVTNTWSQASIMTAPGHYAGLLPDGRVLLEGGGGPPYYRPAGSVELYDPRLDHWTVGSAMASARTAETATLVANGSLLVAGGTTSAQNSAASAELYVPGADRWFSAGAMTTGRHAHAAALLQDGRVLVVGGSGDAGYLASAEVFTPAPAQLELALTGAAVAVNDYAGLTLAGETAAGGHVDVFLEPDATNCAATSAAQAARPRARELFSYGSPAGGFAHTERLPSDTPGRFHVCAFVYREGENGSEPPLLTREASLRVFAPALTVALSSPTAMAGADVTARLSGAVAVASYVDSYVEADAAGCAATSAAERDRDEATELGRIFLDAGDFDQVVDVPVQDPGGYRVCAYAYDQRVNDAEATPLRGEATLTLNPPTMRLTVTPASATVGDPVVGTLEGETGGAAYIDIYAVDDGSSCAPTSADEDDYGPSEYLGTLTVGAGRFAGSRPVSAGVPGTYRVCAYLYAIDADDDAPPLALRDAVVVVRARVPLVGPVIPAIQVTVARPPARLPDRTPPALTLTVGRVRLKTALAKGLIVTVTTSEAGRVCGAATVKGTRVSKCKTLLAPGPATLHLRLTGKAKSAVHHAVHHHRALSIRVSASGRDNAGNRAAVVARTLKLR